MARSVVGIAFYLILCWVYGCLGTPNPESYQLIGSDEPVVAVPGEDVTLPCRLDPELDIQDRTVEWSRLDLQPGPSEKESRADVVFLYRVGVELRDMMIVSYIGRTSLFRDGLKRGDMSLKIRNVTWGDEATYKCFAPSLFKEAHVRLVVDFKAPATETSPLPTDLSAPRSQEETSSGSRSRLALWIPLGVFITLLLTFLACFLQQQRQKRNTEATSCSPLGSAAAVC